jgi:hypothetical protein
MCRYVLFRPAVAITFYCEMTEVLRGLLGCLELVLITIESVRGREGRFANTVRVCF